MNIKKFVPSRKWALWSLLASAVLAVVVTLLIEYRILPKNKFSGDFGSFNSFEEMKAFWFFCFFSFCALFLVFIPLGSKLKLGADWICPYCEDVQTVSKKQKVVLCKKCGQKMVPLKGFYEGKKESINNK